MRRGADLLIKEDSYYVSAPKEAEKTCKDNSLGLSCFLGPKRAWTCGAPPNISKIGIELGLGVSASVCGWQDATVSRFKS